jgi:hypothetical protein
MIAISKHKRQTLSPFVWLWNKVLLAQSFEWISANSPRNTTRQFSQLVRYPQLIFDVGRTTNFQRVRDDAYEFDIRHKRYLGRGAYTLSARAVGMITRDAATGATHISGYVRQGAFYLFALILMTLFVLLSYALVPVSILFLPLAVLMSAVIALHWRYLIADRRDLYREIEMLLQPNEINYEQT